MDIIEKYYEVVEKTLDLLETIESAIDYIKDNQLPELRYEEAFTMLEDVKYGVESIDESIELFHGEINNNAVTVLMNSLKESINNTIESFNQGKHDNIYNQFLSEVYPRFVVWKSELAKALSSYIAS